MRLVRTRSETARMVAVVIAAAGIGLCSTGLASAADELVPTKPFTIQSLDGGKCITTDGIMDNCSKLKFTRWAGSEKTSDGRYKFRTKGGSCLSRDTSTNTFKTRSCSAATSSLAVKAVPGKAGVVNISYNDDRDGNLWYLEGGDYLGTDNDSANLSWVGVQWRLIPVDA